MTHCWPKMKMKEHMDGHKMSRNRFRNPKLAFETNTTTIQIQPIQKWKKKASRFLIWGQIGDESHVSLPQSFFRYNCFTPFP